MKQYFSTDDLRKHVHVLDFNLNREGLEITYKVGDSQRSLVAPPYYASTLLSDVGYLERREVTQEEGQDVLWVEVLQESLEGKEAPIWKTWGHFVDDGARLSQYWALQVVIRHEDTALLKQMSWEISRPIVDPKKN